MTPVDVIEPDDADEGAVGQAIHGEHGGGGRGHERPVPGLVLGLADRTGPVDEPRGLGVVDPCAVALGVLGLEGPESHEDALVRGGIPIREDRFHALGW